MHTVEVEGQHFLVFSCLGSDLSVAQQAAGVTGGTWAARAASALGPYDIANARLLTGPRYYVGRLVQLRDSGEWRYLAFDNVMPDGSFGGTITDPRPVSLVDGNLVLGG